MIALRLPDPRWLLVALALSIAAIWPGRARAEASFCGGGRVCMSSRFLAKAGTAALPAYSWILDANTGFYWAGADQIGVSTGGVRSMVFDSIPGVLYGTTSTSYLQSNASGTGIYYGSAYVLASPTNVKLEPASGFIDANGPFRRLTTTTPVSVDDADGFKITGLAFASFTAAGTVGSGTLQNDTTNNVLRYSNGSAWFVIQKEWALSGYIPDPGAPAALATLIETTTAGVSTVKRLTVQLTNVGPTSASGNYVFTVYDATNTTVLCTLTKTCASGSSSTACSAAVPSGVTLRIRADSSGCGAGTVGAYNAVAQFSGG